MNIDYTVGEVELSSITTYGACAKNNYLCLNLRP